MSFNVTNRTDRADARPIRRSRGDIPVTRPWRGQAITLAELAPLLDEFNRGTDMAKRAYYGRDYYEERNARSGATKRASAKKKGKP